MLSVNSQLPNKPRAKILFYGLQPTLLLAVVAAWSIQPDNANTYLLALIAVQIVLGLAEHFFPARPAWWTPTLIKLRNVVTVTVLIFASAAVTGLYSDWLAQPLAHLRATMGLDVWPHGWPLVLQFFLLLPSALLEFMFGIGFVAAGAAVLLVTQASIAHANVAMNTRWIGLVFTTNTYHICHHSADLAQSNSNYGCAAIVWDRLFGTFMDQEIAEAGTGPTEPSIWRKFLMPLQEPKDTAIAPGSQ